MKLGDVTVARNCVGHALREAGHMDAAELADEVICGLITPYTIRLDYYKPSGKWYSGDNIVVEFHAWHDLVDHVLGMLGEGKVPGLVDGAVRRFTTVMSCPDDDGFVTHMFPAREPTP